MRDKSNITHFDYLVYETAQANEAPGYEMGRYDRLMDRFDIEARKAIMPVRKAVAPARQAGVAVDWPIAFAALRARMEAATEAERASWEWFDSRESLALLIGGAKPVGISQDGQHYAFTADDVAQARTQALYDELNRQR